MAEGLKSHIIKRQLQSYTAVEVTFRVHTTLAIMAEIVGCIGSNMGEKGGHTRPVPGLRE